MGIVAAVELVAFEGAGVVVAEIAPVVGSKRAVG